MHFQGGLGRKVPHRYGHLFFRACELFYYLKGGQVDYGEEHSKACGHSQFGWVCEQGSRI